MKLYTFYLRLEALSSDCISLWMGNLALTYGNQGRWNDAEELGGASDEDSQEEARDRS
jgi:hypothetical protein